MTEILSNKSILIVDDDARLLKALEKVLTQEGATVTCAEFATDAFKILAARSGQFNLVITDLRMPFVSGERAICIIHEILPELPIIVLTAYGDAEVKAECLRKGAAAFLEKPLDTIHLLDVIRHIFDKGKVSRENKQTGSAEP
jgi:DNA-binding NtrC family response regulator